MTNEESRKLLIETIEKKDAKIMELEEYYNDLLDEKDAKIAELENKLDQVWELIKEGRRELEVDS